MINRGRLGAGAFMLAAASLLHAQVPGGTAVPVTPDNFVRAETDMYFAQFAKRGGFGKFNHARDLPLGEDTGVRPNRDTLYSLAVFDLDAGPVTITLPDAGKRFMTMMVVEEGQRRWRKINYITYDDSYSPPKAVEIVQDKEAVRRKAEQW